MVTKAITWLIDEKELEIMNEVGEGAFGKVYKGKWREALVASTLENSHSQNFLNFFFYT